jgi:hypothetical protein
VSLIIVRQALVAATVAAVSRSADDCHNHLLDSNYKAHFAGQGIELRTRLSENTAR